MYIYIIYMYMYIYVYSVCNPQQVCCLYVYIRAGYQFTCFTSTKIQILTAAYVQRRNAEGLAQWARYTRPRDRTGV